MSCDAGRVRNDESLIMRETMVRSLAAGPVPVAAPRYLRIIISAALLTRVRVSRRRVAFDDVYRTYCEKARLRCDKAHTVSEGRLSERYPTLTSKSEHQLQFMFALNQNIVKKCLPQNKLDHSGGTRGGMEACTAAGVA
ncbi:hypothetical protein EVAR_99608_1 [Eumeta japonica]|uniref:Uncharacterized protein n=1 Tax=Eumeta variegata TaxID=151549 RepID=A0A4C1SXI6_EUMVA|nr:hypothetical protein EVAR_99608_1 [Eumeta japonica]